IAIALGNKFGVDRDERGRKYAFPEQVLQDVGDSKAGLESVGGSGVTEVVGENAFAHEAGDPAQQDSRRDQPREVRGELRIDGPPAGRGIRRGGRVEITLDFWRSETP